MSTTNKESPNLNMPKKESQDILKPEPQIIDLSKEKYNSVQDMMTNPVVKLEYTDGKNWFSLATENFVLNSIRSLDPCLAATTENLDADYSNFNSGTAVGSRLVSKNTGVLTIDNVVFAEGSRVLVKNQNTSQHNGIYVVTNPGTLSTRWELTRARTYDSPEQILRGNIITVVFGDVNKTSAWMQTAVVKVIGTDKIIFDRINAESLQKIVGTTHQIFASVFNNIVTLSLAPNPILPGTEGVTLPGGNISDRPTTLGLGMIRFCRYTQNSVAIVSYPFGNSKDTIVTRRMVQDWYDSCGSFPSPDTANPSDIYTLTSAPSGTACLWLGANKWYYNPSGLYSNMTPVSSASNIGNNAIIGCIARAIA